MVSPALKPPALSTEAKTLQISLSCLNKSFVALHTLTSALEVAAPPRLPPSFDPILALAARRFKRFSVEPTQSSLNLTEEREERRRLFMVGRSVGVEKAVANECNVRFYPFFAAL